jgi:hypothetical protein
MKRWFIAALLALTLWTAVGLLVLAYAHWMARSF